VQLHLRLRRGTETSQGQVLAKIRREMAAVDARLPVLTLRSLRQHLEGSFDLWVMRTASRMFAVFGAVAVLLAAVGLYGVRAFSVARRAREIGIRMAVGASAADAVRMVLREGLLVAAVGAGAGLVLALALGRLLAGMLYGVSGSDPLVLAAAAAVLGGVSLLACYVPARRAARVAPMVSLRNE
jgi:ABC-type antimicrobial peptide transport system permease subunit